MNHHYDVVIVGAGSMGMAAGYYLTKAKLRTLLIDAFDPPHVLGSHHGDTRIIRHAYGEGRNYVPLALRAQALWGELEAATGQTLFRQTGVISVNAPGTTFVEEVIASAEVYSLPLEVLTADEIRYRWPGISIPDSYRGTFEPTSGVLFSEACIRAYRSLIEASGATLLANTQVESIAPEQNGATVRTKSATYTADKLIVSAGAWVGKILSRAGLALPLAPTRKAVGWFEADEALYGAERFPAFSFNLPDEQYYGFPSIDGCGLKVGRHDAGQPVDPDQMNREFGVHAEDEGDLRQFLQRCMPQAAGRLKQGKICLYTYTPDEHFIIDRHPEFAHVAIAAGFSGHGFKFSSVVGEILAELAATGETQHDISMFSVQREALQGK